MKWSSRFIALAEEVGNWSKDGKKVGAVLVDADKIVRSLGYNGLPKHFDDASLEFLDGDDKAHLVVHAEENALQHLPEECYGKELTLYVTKPPCKLCALSIINSKANINKIVYVPYDSETFNRRYCTDVSFELLTQAGIELVPFTKE